MIKQLGASVGTLAIAASVLVACNSDPHRYDCNAQQMQNCGGGNGGGMDSLLEYAMLMPFITGGRGVYGQPGYVAPRTIYPNQPGYVTTTQMRPADQIPKGSPTVAGKSTTVQVPRPSQPGSAPSSKSSGGSSQNTVKQTAVKAPAPKQPAPKVGR